MADYTIQSYSSRKNTDGHLMAVAGWLPRSVTGEGNNFENG